MNANLAALLALTVKWPNYVPATWRQPIYRALKYVMTALTVALVLLPFLPQLEAALGWHVTSIERWSAIATALLAAVTHMADVKTSADTLVPPPYPEQQGPAPTGASMKRNTKNMPSINYDPPPTSIDEQIAAAKKARTRAKSKA